MKIITLGKPPSIHIKVAARLLPVWLLISLVLGAATFWLENRRVDAYVFDIASEAAERYNDPRHASLFEGDPRQHEAFTQNFLKETAFVGIRLYAKDKGLRYQTWTSQEITVLAANETHKHVFPGLGRHHYNKFRDKNDTLYIQVVIPLVGDRQEIYGYFEGIYRVSSETSAVITNRVRDTLVFVLVIVGLVTLALYPLIIALSRDERRAADALLKSNVELMQTMGSAIAKRDADTAAHNYRVTLYSVELAKALYCSHGQIAALIAGAFLHDVGKIGISDNILLKPAKLTSEEFEIIKTHVSLGEDIVLESSWLEKAREVVTFHHEKYDGTGYLRGLRGEGIPLNARLFAVVDVFDALTSQRPYKKAMALEEAMAIIRAGSGSHFDPGIVDIFETLALQIHESYANAEEAELRHALAAVTRDYF